MLSITEWAESQEKGRGFYVDRHYDEDNQKWILRPGPIRLADYHADILRHVFTPDERGQWPYSVVAWCEPAKSGKSAIAGLVSQFVAMSEANSNIIMASNKQAQAASLMFKSLTDSIALNPHHRRRLDPGKFAVTMENQTTIKAIPSNSKGEAGARFSLACFDELWAYQYEDSKRLWAEMKPDPTQQRGSMRLAIGYAGYLESELWLTLLEDGANGEAIPELGHITNPDGSPTCFRNERGKQFTFWSHAPRQPWQTPEWLDALGLSASEVQRMIYCYFVKGLGNFCSDTEWKMLIDPEHKPLGPNKKIAVYVGLDVATSQAGDDCAVVAVYSDGPKIKVAWHKVWAGRERQSRLKLGESLEPYLIQKARDYNIVGVWFDRYQAERSADELEKHGIKCHMVQQTRSTRGPKDTRLQGMVADQELVLYDDPDLKNASAGANAFELGNGLIFIKKASREKIDLLVSLSNVANEALIAPAMMRQVSNIFYGGHWPEESEQEFIERTKKLSPIVSYVGRGV